jgi:hypothetical protein
MALVVNIDVNVNFAYVFAGQACVRPACPPEREP